MMSTRSNNCKCGYLLCYVAARVLHFSAFICIASTQNPNDVKVYPSNGNGIGTIHLGLLGQLHYVGLDKIVEQPNAHDKENEATIDNENIHESDEYNRRVTGGPMECCMLLEKHETDASIFSGAPAEGKDHFHL